MDTHDAVEQPHPLQQHLPRRRDEAGQQRRRAVGEVVRDRCSHAVPIGLGEAVPAAAVAVHVDEAGQQERPGRIGTAASDPHDPVALDLDHAAVDLRSLADHRAAQDRHGGSVSTFRTLPRA
jgi:hypothetical protein